VILVIEQKGIELGKAAILKMDKGNAQNAQLEVSRLAKILVIRARHAGSDYEVPEKKLQGRELEISRLSSHDLVGMLLTKEVLYGRSALDFGGEPLKPTTYLTLSYELLKRYSAGGEARQGVEDSLSAFTLDMGRMLDAHIKPILHIINSMPIGKLVQDQAQFHFTVGVP